MSVVLLAQLDLQVSPDVQAHKDLLAPLERKVDR